MTPLLALLLGASEPGLTPLDRLSATNKALINSFNRSILVLDTAQALTKDDMLAAFARDLQLPEWFGNNLDAAHEALHDRLGAEDSSLLVVLAPPSNADARATDVFIDVVSSVLVDQAKRGLLVGPEAQRILSDSRS